ncbi:MAG: hypothetical protein HQK55_07320 [Deltaproteobacteria bacterium]|nr:hypothetical protein [Deltaproteobacteria bacterium]
MKIGFVSHVFPPSWSGQAVMIGRILESMDPNDYCLISVADYSQDGPGNDFISRLPGKYYHLPPEKKINWRENTKPIHHLNKIWAIMSRGRRIARILKAEGCEVVVAGTGDHVDLPAALVAGRLSGVPFYPYLFDDYLEQWRHDPMFFNLAQRINPLIYKFAAGAIAPNEFMADKIQKQYGLTPTIVRNPCPENVQESISPNLYTNEEEIVVLYSGAIYQVNFGPLKCLKEAMDLTGRPNLKLHLYTAQPEDYLACHGISGNHVVYVGHVPPSRIGTVQASSHINFLPLGFDTPYPEIVKTSSPGKLGDYLASGAPILAQVPEDSFVSYYLKKHDCAVVVNECDPAALAAGLTKIIQDRQLRRKISSNARERARIDFAPEKVRARFLAALRDKH